MRSKIQTTVLYTLAAWAWAWLCAWFTVNFIPGEVLIYNFLAVFTGLTGFVGFTIGAVMVWFPNAD